MTVAQTIVQTKWPPLKF